MTDKTKGKKNLLYALAVFILTILLIMAWGASGGSSAPDSGKEADQGAVPDASNPGSSEVGVYGAVPEGNGDSQESGIDTAEDWAAEEAEAGEEWMEAAEDEDHDAELDYRVFSSRKMGFSFLYDASNSVRMTETGAAEMTVNGNEHLTGLTVSVANAKDMPDVSSLLNQASADAVSRYGENFVQEPEQSPLEIEGHNLAGILYIYADDQDQAILCTYFIEQRENKLAIFRTEGFYEGDGQELEALGGAVITLEFDPDIYAESQGE